MFQKIRFTILQVHGDPFPDEGWVKHVLAFFPDIQHTVQRLWVEFQYVCSVCIDEMHSPGSNFDQIKIRIAAS